MQTAQTSPIQHRALAFLVLLLLAFAILIGMIGRNLHQFNTVLSHVNYSQNVQNVSVELQQALIEYVREAGPMVYPDALIRTEAALNKMLAEMDALMADGGYFSPNARTSIATVREFLKERGALDSEKNARLLNALRAMSLALDHKIMERDHLLKNISNDTEDELYMAFITILIILILAVLFLYRRILHPLNDLKQLLQRLTEESYIPIATEQLDPLLLPVFTSYNEMVIHLAELEEAKRSHAQSLQTEVRIATQALLEQQNNLARAERLAAIGEVAAELAHEIRNPLAGIQMAFSNLRREIVNEQQCERMDLIGSELKRLAKLLNDLLDQSRHSPEPVTCFNVAELIKDLVALTRYQIAESIQLSIDVSGPLWVNLPASGLRQALLNLILNAADVLEDTRGEIGIQAYQDEMGLHVNVLDNGPGFSQDLLTHGIRPFRTSRQRGTGLGLAMVQRFVKEMDGVLKLSNQASGGAMVSMLFPEQCFAK